MAEPRGIKTDVILDCDAAIIFSLSPPTGPIKPPEVIVPVSAVELSVSRLFSKATVKTEIEAPALGPPMIVVSPYVRVGAGMYTGGWEQGEWDGDYDSAIGFNIGAGVKTLPGIYAEFIYHIVKRKGDWEGAESMGANNWGIHVGYQLGLGL